MVRASFLPVTADEGPQLAILCAPSSIAPIVRQTHSCQVARHNKHKREPIHNLSTHAHPPSQPLCGPRHRSGSSSLADPRLAITTSSNTASECSRPHHTVAALPFAQRCLPTARQGTRETSAAGCLYASRPGRIWEPRRPTPPAQALAGAWRAGSASYPGDSSQPARFPIR
ncbi:hypothetical protein K469DRAFT_256539 [Zopfia rhizophila CBS 207.26]|uniref:Uncharacterized protein n=1 Tax=Zopfia rhizophila CBS 207.26 TaxID=1314779 RepID=A0A6A6DUT6_9PEZI|nr:hypothetical protein K469DRAFT_256539 [Zopfia rhizophila CBS 207.26]